MNSARVFPLNATSEGVGIHRAHTLHFCPRYRQRCDGGGFSAENGVAQRSSDPVRLFKKLKFVRSPAALGADREREGHNFTLIVQDFAERRSALVFGEDDAQVAADCIFSG